ncbi:hypothetical protein C8J57DRAFT_1505534 [Mycena rebaudengoi]|nr:hypothetical protein C8J57DRAFT_1505534 [Mycena rebaudengoi]
MSSHSPIWPLLPTVAARAGAERTPLAPPAHVPSAPATSRTQHTSAPFTTSARPTAAAPPRRRAFREQRSNPFRTHYTILRPRTMLFTVFRESCAVSQRRRDTSAQHLRSSMYIVWCSTARGILKQNMAVQVGVMPACLLYTPSAALRTTHRGLLCANPASGLCRDSWET